jgi:hypothetical protein
LKSFLINSELRINNDASNYVSDYIVASDDANNYVGTNDNASDE